MGPACSPASTRAPSGPPCARWRGTARAAAGTAWGTAAGPSWSPAAPPAAPPPTFARSCEGGKEAAVGAQGDCGGEGGGEGGGGGARGGGGGVGTHALPHGMEELYMCTVSPARSRSRGGGASSPPPSLSWPGAASASSTVDDAPSVTSHARNRRNARRASTSAWQSRTWRRRKVAGRVRAGLRWEVGEGLQNMWRGWGGAGRSGVRGAATTGRRRSTAAAAHPGVWGAFTTHTTYRRRTLRAPLLVPTHAVETFMRRARPRESARSPGRLRCGGARRRRSTAP